MKVLIGATGYVGGHLAEFQDFDVSVTRRNLSELNGLSADLIVCCGLPAAKWVANSEVQADFDNMAKLAQALTTCSAKRFVLISTVDVYANSRGMDEFTPPSFDGLQAYGRHRAWFEAFVRSNFPDSLVLRLPALFSQDLRKNLIFDLIHERSEQYSSMNPASTFQFFNTRRLHEVMQTALNAGINTLNIATEPISAAQIGDVFGVSILGEERPLHYDMRTRFGHLFERNSSYLATGDQVLSEIRELAVGFK